MRQNIPDALLVVGLASVVVGCALFSLALGLIVGGALLVVLGFALGGS